MRRSPRHRYLPQQPIQFRELHSEFEKETMALRAIPTMQMTAIGAAS